MYRQETWQRDLHFKRIILFESCLSFYKFVPTANGRHSQRRTVGNVGRSLECKQCRQVRRVPHGSHRKSPLARKSKNKEEKWKRSLRAYLDPKIVDSKFPGTLDKEPTLDLNSLFK